MSTDSKFRMCVLGAGLFATLMVAAASILHAQGNRALVGPLTGNEIVHVIPLQANGQLGASEAQVTIAQVVTGASFGPQRSHSPANANGAPPSTVKRCGCFLPFAPVHS